MKRYLAAFASTVALAGSLAACGGSGDTGLDKAELIAKGDAICQAGQDVMNEKAAAVLKTNPSPATLGEFIVATAVPAYQNQLAKLRALEPDEESRESWDAMLNKLDQGIGEIKADPTIVLKPDSSPLEEAGTAAREFGLKVCGSGD